MVGLLVGLMGGFRGFFGNLGFREVGEVVRGLWVLGRRRLSEIEEEEVVPVLVVWL